MAIELLGSAGMTNELKQTYDRILLSVAKQNLAFANYGIPKTIPARGGKSVEWRRFEKIDIGTHTLTEGTPPSVTNLTVSTVVATVSQYGAYAQLSDMLETQAFDNTIAEFAEKFGIHMQEVMDGVVRDAILAGVTTNQYAGAGTSVGTSVSPAVGSGCYLDAAELKEAENTLSRANAKKIGGAYKCFIHPDNRRDLFNDAEISDAFQYAAGAGANNPLFTGVLGRWNGIDFIETTNLKLRTSYGMSGADIYEVLMIGEEFYGVTKLDSQQARLIVHPRGSGGHTDPLEQFSTIGWKAAITAKVLNTDWGLRIYCASSRTPAA